MKHIPVLLKQVLKCLDPKPNENFIDATLGQAGHAVEILKKIGPEGLLLGIDQDILQTETSRPSLEEFGKRVILVKDSYANLKNIIEKTNFKSVNGILLDLGMSSWQLEESGRGFTFLKNEVLDMRYDISQTLTAEKIINEYPEDEIEKILRVLGEEKFSKKIAKTIAEKRKIKRIKSTFELKDIILQSMAGKFKNNRIHFATRSFQALRIAVNGELENLKNFLPSAFEILAKEGRLAVISFHSLEDRIVKNFFKLKLKEGFAEVLTSKPLIAKADELRLNPRARSAKLRAIIKIQDQQDQIDKK